MKLSLKIGIQDTTWSQVRAVFLAADGIEAYSAGWVNDHLYNPWYPRHTQSTHTFEAFTVMAGLVEATDRIRIGSMVAGNLFRHPALVARMAATLDHMSDGRFELGLGAGWLEEEHRAVGIDLLSPADRIAKWDEACEIVHRLLTEDVVSHDGRHYQLTEARSEPKCVQQPRVPLVLGALGEQLALRVVAKWADHWNFDADIELLERKLTSLRSHCDAVGRDAEEIEVSAHVWEKDVGRIADLANELEARGADHLVVASAAADVDFFVAAADAFLNR